MRRLIEGGMFKEQTSFFCYTTACVMISIFIIAAYDAVFTDSDML
jgi:hypothetical protein